MKLLALLDTSGSMGASHVPWHIQRVICYLSQNNNITIVGVNHSSIVEYPIRAYLECASPKQVLDFHNEYQNMEDICTIACMVDVSKSYSTEDYDAVVCITDGVMQSADRLEEMPPNTFFLFTSRESFQTFTPSAEKYAVVKCFEYHEADIDVPAEMPPALDKLEAFVASLPDNSSGRYMFINQKTGETTRDNHLNVIFTIDLSQPNMQGPDGALHFIMPRVPADGLLVVDLETNIVYEAKAVNTGFTLSPLKTEEK